MTTQFKTKEQVRAEQKASQDISSQDAQSAATFSDEIKEIFISSQNNAYQGCVKAFKQGTRRGVDLFRADYNLGGNVSVFFDEWSEEAKAISLGVTPITPLLQVSQFSDDELNAMCDRNDHLVEQEKLGLITNAQKEELDTLQKQLLDAGRIK